MPKIINAAPKRYTSEGAPITVTADIKLAVRESATGPQVICRPPTKKAFDDIFFLSFMAKKTPIPEDMTNRQANTT